MRISDWSSDVCSSDLTPLLEKLGVHYVEEDPSISTRLKQREEWHPQSSALDLDLGTGGARMRRSEYLVDIDGVESRALPRPCAAEVGTASVRDRRRPYV